MQNWKRQIHWILANEFNQSVAGNGRTGSTVKKKQSGTLILEKSIPILGKLLPYSKCWEGGEGLWSKRNLLIREIFYISLNHHFLQVCRVQLQIQQRLWFSISTNGTSSLQDPFKTTLYLYEMLGGIYSMNQITTTGWKVLTGVRGGHDYRTLIFMTILS